MAQYSLQITVLIILIIVVIFLIRTSKSIQCEKRISRFTLSSENEYHISFFDQVFKFLWRFIYRFADCLKKLRIFNKYSFKYEKYITYENRDTKNCFDFIAIKFSFAILLVFLYMLSSILQNTQGNVLSLTLFLIIGFFGPDIYWRVEYYLRNQKTETDLLKAITMMNNAFKSGHNVLQAIEMVKNETSGPIADEFQKIYVDVNYGLGLDVAFKRFAERVNLEDAAYISSTLALHNKTGGNIIKVFDAIQKHIFTKRKLKNELKALTGPSTLMYRFLLILPIAFIAIITLLSPSYFNPIFETLIGLFILIIVICLYFLYIRAIKTIVRIDLK